MLFSPSSAIHNRSPRSSSQDKIHARALLLARRYQEAEGALIDILQQVDQQRVYLKLGHPSLFRYVTRELGLSENVAYSLIGVARKSQEIPDLKSSVQNGTLSLSHARRIVPLLNSENKREWISKAETLSLRQLEKEIARVRPEAATAEKATYTSSERVKLQLGLSEKEMLRLRRIQDLVSQQKRRSVSLEETLGALCDEYLKRKDPLEKATRQRVRKGTTPPAASGNLPTGGATSSAAASSGEKDKLAHGKSPRPRIPLPAAVVHAVHLRDQRRCTYQHEGLPRCNETRWIEIHHVLPISKGGGNELENLVTLCSAHHRSLHTQSHPTLSPVETPSRKTELR